MKHYFLILETDGSQQQEDLGIITETEAREIAIDALEDAETTYLYPAYNDGKYGLQPALHLDYYAKFNTS